MRTTNNPVIDQFIIEASIIDPISKIVIQLNNGEFRDCDIKWLDAKLERFTKFACETLGISGMMPSDENNNVVEPSHDFINILFEKVRKINK